MADISWKISLEFRRWVPGGAATEAIHRDRVKSSRVPLAALGTFSLAPSATLSFHKENSVIAEGLVPLRVPGLD